MNMTYELSRVVWEITSKCNMNCIHCGSDCSCEIKGEELTTAECLSVIDDLADVGCKLIFLSGGEPLLREDLGVLISSILLHGMKVAIISNAYMVNEETIKKLKEYHLLAYGISVDAGEAYLHDYIRGLKNSFNHIEHAIKLLNENNIVPSVVTTVHKLNYDQLPKIRDFLIKNNVKMWQIQYGDHIGRMSKECQITEAQYLEIAKFILETRKKYSNHFVNVTGADVFGYMNDMSNELFKVGYWDGCMGGLLVAGISAEGSVRGCLSMQDDKYIEDNVRNRSFKEIWNDKNSFKYNRRFDCSSLTGYCKNCLYATICKGGCMRSASLDGGRCSQYCLYKIEQEGFSSPEQARVNFSKQEIFDLYNPIRKLPDEFLNSK